MQNGREGKTLQGCPAPITPITDTMVDNVEQADDCYAAPGGIQKDIGYVHFDIHEDSGITQAGDDIKQGLTKRFELGTFRPEFRAKHKFLGPKGQYFNHIRCCTGARVWLSEDPLQVVVNADSAEALTKASDMFSDLAATVEADYARWNGFRKATSDRHGGENRLSSSADDDVLQSRATEILASSQLDSAPSGPELKQPDQAAGPSPGLPQTTATRRAHARPARLGRRSDGAPFAGGGATS